MALITVVYDFFAHATAGSVPNHLAHCVLAAGIQLVVALVLLRFRQVGDAVLLGAIIASAFHIGRSQAQTEVLWTPARWYVSWLFWAWPSDQAWGSIFPIVSTFATYVAVRCLSSWWEHSSPPRPTPLNG